MNKAFLRISLGDMEGAKRRLFDIWSMDEILVEIFVLESYSVNFGHTYRNMLEYLLQIR
jgi:hypothetical protein